MVSGDPDDIEVVVVGDHLQHQPILGVVEGERLGREDSKEFLDVSAGRSRLAKFVQVEAQKLGLVAVRIPPSLSRGIALLKGRASPSTIPCLIKTT
jgi:hypothetical protein